MTQGFVQAAQAVQVSHDQFKLARPRQCLTGARHKAAAIQQACETVLIRSREFGFRRDDTSSTHPLFQPDTAPNAHATATHTQAHGNLGSRILQAQDILGQGAILGQSQRSHRRR